jgi:PIN domain nuclease of toxin-antitoxin system
LTSGAILLDTHAWLWLVSEPGLLSDGATQAIAQAERLLLSSISPWELAIKHQQGRLRFDFPIREWMDAALSVPRLELVPLSPEVAIRSAELRGIVGRDPADSVIAATAIISDVPIVTRDRVLSMSDTVRVVW